MKKATPEERKFSKPEYGGTMNLRIDSNIVTFDPNAKSFNYSIMSGWLETLHAGYGHWSRYRLTKSSDI